MDKSEIVRRLEEKGTDSTDLDDHVHHAKSCEGTAINNSGLKEQVEYLIECYGADAVSRLLGVDDI